MMNTSNLEKRLNPAEKILGKTATDKITGFSGVVTGYVQYITGNNQALITPRVNDSGNLPDSIWFEERRLDVDTNKPALVFSGGPLDKI